VCASSVVSRRASGRRARGGGVVCDTDFDPRARGDANRDRGVGRTVGERAYQSALSRREIGVDLVHRARCLHGVASTSGASTTIGERLEWWSVQVYGYNLPRLKFNFIRVESPKLEDYVDHNSLAVDMAVSHRIKVSRNAVLVGVPSSGRRRRARVERRRGGGAHGAASAMKSRASARPMQTST